MTDVAKRDDGPLAQPRSIERIELGGAYQGWWAEFDADMTLGGLEDFQSGDFARMRSALAESLTDWNFRDKRGEPLVPDADGLKGVGTALLRALVEGVGTALATPKAG